MRITLCMIVKDEAATLVECLHDIADLFDDIVVVDTGSSDATREILRSRFGVETLTGKLDEQRCFSKSGARNLGYARVKTPWILNLDADERISRAQLARLLDLPDDSQVAGYFCRWDTHQHGVVIEDYKLALFRCDIRASGCAHENAQIDLRRKRRQACWTDAIRIDHFPDQAKTEFKRRFYRERLLCALQAEPHWYRYHWFLGYSYYRDGDMHEAHRYLSQAAESESATFPVECLNAKMLLTCIYAARGERNEALRVVDTAQAFHPRVADDCEVQINFRMKPWLDAAQRRCRCGELNQIAPYAFYC